MRSLCEAPANGPQDVQGSQRHPLTATVHGASLTDRESEVLGWVAMGLQNKEIALAMAISVATVRNHVHHLLEKIGAHSKLEAASLAFRCGWVAGGGSVRPER